MPPKSVPLTAQLLLTVVGPIVATVIVLTTVTYQIVRTNLDREARSRVSVAARSRADLVSRLVIAQYERAERFIAATATLCGEPKPTGVTAWEPGCIRSALQEFRITEHAVGALLLSDTRRVASTGRVPSRDLVFPTGLAVLQPTSTGAVSSYVLRASNGRASLTMVFNVADFRPYFDERSSLGESGEVFLRTADGTFLTPPRFGWTMTTPPGAISSEAGHVCNGAAEWRAIDYRGVPTFHGLYPVDVFAGGACVDAHVPVDEALSPAEDLLFMLVGRGSLFVGLGLLLGLLASRWLAAPVLRLSASARALQNGDFDRPIRIEGPSEVRQLGRSLATMARALGEMVGRERRARQEAETANRAKDEFLAVLSHELRTPLTATLGWTRLLRSGHLDPQRSTRAIEAIERSALTQTRLVNDLLDVSRIIAGRLQLERDVIALADPIHAALEEVRSAADRKGIAIETSLAPDVLVPGDALRLQQIVSNLVTNAIKFTASGGRVQVRLTRDHDQAEVAVTDTGVGISPDFLPFVFDRFRQADSGPTRPHGGLGLGLAIVRHLVRLHGGSVQAMSAGHGKGATFAFQVPLADPAATVTRPAAGSVDRGARAERLNGVTVLVVEDDDETRSVIAAMLDDVGAVVVTAASAESARRALLSVRPAVLVSDIAMPEEDGYTFLRSLRAADFQVPAIALTAYARREDAAEAFAAGFQLHLPKPVNRSVLVGAIAALAAPTRGGAAESSARTA
jgi:signal transduction histidine kinase/ActR/RegA family two-component response regulator